MNNSKGFVLSTYIYILLVFFLLLLGTMLTVLNNTRMLSNKLKENSKLTSGLIDNEYSFILLGDKEITIMAGEEYVEPGYIAKTIAGIDLTEYVVIMGNVDTSQPGDYTLKYTITHNGKTKELERNIRVKDNNLINFINQLYLSAKEENGLIKDDTADQNIRYSGNDIGVKNYVEFGNKGELWRIIGIFNTSSMQDETLQPRVKLVRDNSIGKYSWDSSALDVNSGQGINQWGQAKYENGNEYEGSDLMQVLNGIYLNKQSGYCCKNEGKAKCDAQNGASVCNFTQIGMSVLYKNMIDEVVWNTSYLSHNAVITPLNAYLEERRTTVKSSSSIVYTPTWIGKVGLVYPSDYGYAGIGCTDLTEETCGATNWLNKSDGMHLITYVDNVNLGSTWFINYTRIRYNQASIYREVYPSVFLNSNVKIVDGDGTMEKPYKLKL